MSPTEEIGFKNELKDNLLPQVFKYYIGLVHEKKGEFLGKGGTEVDFVKLFDAIGEADFKTEFPRRLRDGDLINTFPVFYV